MWKLDEATRCNETLHCFPLNCRPFSLKYSWKMLHILEGMHIRQGVPKANKLRTTRNVPNLPKKKRNYADGLNVCNKIFHTPLGQAGSVATSMASIINGSQRAVSRTCGPGLCLLAGARLLIRSRVWGAEQGWRLKRVLRCPIGGYYSDQTLLHRKEGSSLQH